MRKKKAAHVVRRFFDLVVKKYIFLYYSLYQQAAFSVPSRKS